MKECTSSEARGAAEVIGSCGSTEDLARLVIVSTASSGIGGSELAEGICTSWTPPLEVSSVVVYKEWRTM
jgi:hypothetical protein